MDADLNQNTNQFSKHEDLQSQGNTVESKSNTVQQNIFYLKEIKAIVGLGNIGKEYKNTRHNVGFDFLDYISNNSAFKENKKLRCLESNYIINNHKIILVKPITMMNNSGICVNLFSKYYKINLENILVVHDDLDIELGNYKLQFARGPKAHNGVNSIEKILKSKKFWRLRIGINNRTSKEKNDDFNSGADYVLSRFTETEFSILVDVFREIKHNLFDTFIQ